MQEAICGVEEAKASKRGSRKIAHKKLGHFRLRRSRAKRVHGSFWV